MHVNHVGPPARAALVHLTSRRPTRKSEVRAMQGAIAETEEMQEDCRNNPCLHIVGVSGEGSGSLLYLKEACLAPQIRPSVLGPEDVDDPLRSSRGRVRRGHRNTKKNKKRIPSIGHMYCPDNFSSSSEPTRRPPTTEIMMPANTDNMADVHALLTTDVDLHLNLLISNHNHTVREALASLKVLHHWCSQPW